MITRKTYISAFSFSFVSGIINVLGILLLGLVVTNVTGHYSATIVTSRSLAIGDILLTCFYIFMYWFGSFWASSCYHIGKRIDNAFIKALPTLLNLVILLFAVYSQHLIVWLLFFVSSTQNALGANHTENQVRASQITGVVMATGLDMAKYFFADCSNDCKRSVFKTFTVKMLNIAGFVIGGITALYQGTTNVLWLPIIFYGLASLLILKRKL